MGAALSARPHNPADGPEPEHGVRVSPGLVDALTGHARPAAAAAPTARPDSSPSPSGRGRPERELSPSEQEALRILHRDSELASALRRAQVVGDALLKVEEGEAARVAARARELVGGPLGGTTPATPPCGPAAAAVAACFEEVASQGLADEGGALACGPVVAAYERCARDACAVRVLGDGGGPAAGPAR